MNRSVFHRLSRIAFEEAGIHLPPGKEALVSSRISKRIRQLGLEGEKEYLDYLLRDGTGKEVSLFLDAITTNFTNFLREPDHFELLHRWASELLARGRKRFRVWCAAAATGEEPYSIALTLCETFQGRVVDFKILATDISGKALAAAKRGVYKEKAVAPIPRPQRSKYFDKIEDSGSGEILYEVRPVLKERILFRRLNLAKPPYPMKGPIDVIFCRNVMIYFQTPTRQTVVDEAERLLAPGGLFITGHSDTLAGVKTGLVTVKPSVYRKPTGGAEDDPVA